MTFFRESRESRDTRSRTVRKSRAPKAPAAPLGVKGMLTVFAIGAIGTALGVTQVKVQFDARDYAIEARRVQELAQLRRDEVRKLEARIGGLKAGQNLREVALGPFGMVEPETVSSIEVDGNMKDEFAKAAQEAEAALKARREQYARAGKEALQGPTAP